MLKLALAASLLPLAGLGWSAPAAAEPDHEIHQQLRAVIGGLQTAINARKFDELAPYFSTKMRVTTINQEVLSNPAEIAPYFKKWFGAGGFLKDLTFSLAADAATELNPAKDYGIVRGSGVENYVLADGRHFDMKTRWTATVVREADHRWRILTLHIGANFLDNPILDAAKAALIRVGLLAALGGLIVGGAAAFALTRRKSA